ncbi:AAA family ATPase [Flavobacterium sp.]|uniref:AAA family ATPase n=1 Tax=Flavobacterium sp. TaxID=239 RepID=UPI002637799B|nr:AAA family ATPase [Flavobacterium sp.]
MNIKKITIQNFRNISEERTFYLDPSFTVFIGVNGKGKSTILHALRIASGAFFLAIPEVKSRHIAKDEIRILDQGKFLLQQFPVKVEAVGRFTGNSEEITWRRKWLEGKSASTYNSTDVGEIKKIAADRHNLMVKHHTDRIDLPIIAFFGISRAVGAGRMSKKSKIQRLGRQIFKEGYQDWEEMKAVKFHYHEWLQTYDTLVRLGKEYNGTKEAFFSAIRTANPFITEIEFINGELWLKIKIDDEETGFLPISSHSDGIHYFTAMVAEIAYRCIALNGYRMQNAITDTNGIILIDEIDLHLHPRWQRHVVQDLKKAFPRIQFVVTTHSPFIVQSLNSNELYNLDDEYSDVNPTDLSIGEIAQKVMGTSSTMSVENAKNEQLSLEYLQTIKSKPVNATEILNKIEIEVSDPGVRALLKLKRLESKL